MPAQTVSGLTRSKAFRQFGQARKSQTKTSDQPFAAELAGIASSSYKSTFKGLKAKSIILRQVVILANHNMPVYPGARTKSVQLEHSESGSK